MIIWCLFLSVAWLLYRSYRNNMFYWESLNVKQGTPFPILGDSYQIYLKIKSLTETVIDCYTRFQNVRYSGIYQGKMRTLILHDPDLIKQLTIKDFDYFVDHINFAGDFEPLWSKSLFALKGDKWREMRATLSPSFTSTKMRAMFELIEQSAQQYVEFYFNQKDDIIELEMKNSVGRFAIDVIASCGFGVTVDSLKDPNNVFHKNGKHITSLFSLWQMMIIVFSMIMPKVVKFLDLHLFSRESTDFFKRIIRDTIAYREKNNIYRPDMIHQLMEAQRGQLKYDEVIDKNLTGFATVEESEIGRMGDKTHTAMSEDDMAAQVLIFFFAGFDTVSTLISFACYELAVHPEYQEKLIKEVDATLNVDNGKLTYDALNQMKYMDMVISETLRKNPPFPVMDRLCTKAYTIQPRLPNETPVHLEPGNVLWLPIAGIHWDEKYYSSPKQFDPERFSEENKAKIKPFTYLPFGSGPRNCIGSRFALMEAKTLLFHLLKNFELIVTEKTRIPIVYSADHFSPLIKGGFWLGLKRRDVT